MRGTTAASVTRDSSVCSSVTSSKTFSNETSSSDWMTGGPSPATSACHVSRARSAASIVAMSSLSRSTGRSAPASVADAKVIDDWSTNRLGATSGAFLPSGAGRRLPSPDVRAGLNHSGAAWSSMV